MGGFIVFSELVSSLVPLVFWRFPLTGGGGGYIYLIVTRLIWDFVYFFIYFDTGFLFISFEKILIHFIRMKGSIYCRIGEI